MIDYKPEGEINPFLPQAPFVLCVYHSSRKQSRTECFLIISKKGVHTFHKSAGRLSLAPMQWEKGEDSREGRRDLEDMSGRGVHLLMSGDPDNPKSVSFLGEGRTKPAGSLGIWTLGSLLQTQRSD